MQKFTLKCQYLGDLQITRGLSREDLAHPAIFRACGSRTGTTITGGEFLKLSPIPARFVDAAGSSLPSDPFSWPDGRAIEIGCGPWHRDDAPVDEVTEMFLQESPGLSLAVQRAMVATRSCDDLLEMSLCKLIERVPNAGYRSTDWAHVDWEATFDPAGVNAQAIEWLDGADWKLTLDGLPGLAAGAVKGPEIAALAADWLLHGDDIAEAHWRFPTGHTTGDKTGDSAVLLWRQESLIDGAILGYRSDYQASEVAEPSENPDPFAPESYQYFDNVQEALLHLGLTAPGFSDASSLMAAARDRSGRPVGKSSDRIWRESLEAVVVNRQ